jgi:hypothetical protein
VEHGEGLLRALSWLKRLWAEDDDGYDSVETIKVELKAGFITNPALLSITHSDGTAFRFRFTERLNDGLSGRPKSNFT